MSGFEGLMKRYPSQGSWKLNEGVIVEEHDKESIEAQGREAEARALATVRASKAETTSRADPSNIPADKVCEIGMRDITAKVSKRESVWGIVNSRVLKASLYGMWPLCDEIKENEESERRRCLKCNQREGEGNEKCFFIRRS